MTPIFVWAGKGSIPTRNRTSIEGFYQLIELENLPDTGTLLRVLESLQPAAVGTDDPFLAMQILKAEYTVATVHDDAWVFTYPTND